ncbi:MAG: rhomboid family intramembrane serine protease [Gemmatimonadaceae bacterium]
MSYTVSEDQDYPRITPAVQWLIVANVAIFFLQLTVLGDNAVQSALGFELRDIDQWWTIFTYMFVHAGLFHVGLNMYLLWLFGRRVEHVWSAGGFTRYYLWCGLGGWLFHLLFDKHGLLVGASAAVLGVMLAYAMRWPDDEIYLFGIVPMKVKWLVVLMAVLDLVQGMIGSGPVSGVAYFAHIGGLAFGWLYLRTPAAPSIDRLKQRISQVPDESDEPPRAIPRSLPRGGGRERAEIDEIVARSKAAVAKQSTSPAVRSPAVREPRATELDLVLDKISARGMESLTKEERRVLDEMSRRLRGNV